MDLLGAVEGGLDVGHDVFAADVIEEAGLQKQLGGLLHGAAEDQARGPSACRRLANVSMAWMPVASMAVMLRRRRITIGRKDFEIGGGFDQLFGGAEEKRAVDAQDRDVGRDDAALQDVGQAVADVLVGDGRDGGGFGDAVDVEQRGERPCPRRRRR